MATTATGPGTARQLLTVRDVAKLFGVSTTAVYGMAADGRLPGVKIGSQLRFPPDWIDDWLAEHRIDTPRKAR